MPDYPEDVKRILDQASQGTPPYAAMHPDQGTTVAVSVRDATLSDAARLSNRGFAWWHLVNKAGRARHIKCTVEPTQSRIQWSEGNLSVSDDGKLLIAEKVEATHPRASVFATLPLSAGFQVLTEGAEIIRTDHRRNSCDATIEVVCADDEMPRRRHGTSAPAGAPPPAVDEEASAVVSALGRVNLNDHTIVGTYVRSQKVVRPLCTVTNRLAMAMTRRAALSESFLVWGASGQGKTFIVEEAVRVQTGGELVRIDLKDPALTEKTMRETLKQYVASDAPGICLIDEIDSRPEEKWPYDVLYGTIEAHGGKSTAAHNRVFVLVGSTPPDIDALIKHMKTRHKGNDLVNRIPMPENQVVIPPLDAEDRAVVAISIVKHEAATEGKWIEAIERGALYYLVSSPYMKSAHNLKNCIRHGVQRIPAGDDELRMRDLFDRADDALLYAAVEALPAGLCKLGPCIPFK